jgi:mono/diheme cytochrome c family protein
MRAGAVKTFLLGFITSVVVLAICTFAYFRLGFAEVPSDATSPVWESWLMRTAVHASVRRRASQLQTPLAANQDALVEGGKLYLAGCAGCHGQLGKAEADLSHYPRVPQFAQAGTQYSEPEMYWIIKHGIRMTAMSAYGPFYTDKQMWAIASFLHRIQGLPPGVVERLHSK